MQVFTVHEPPNPPADRLDRAESLLFLRDGFSWGALFFGPLWLVAKANWAGFAAYLIAAILMSALLRMFGAGEQAITLALFALNLFLAFEASSLQSLMLERSGWEELGTVIGRDAGECERRFFETWLPGQPAIAAYSPHDTTGTLAASAGELGRANAADGLRRLFTRKI